MWWRTWLILALGAAGCVGGQTGDPGEMPGRTCEMITCAARAETALEQQLARFGDGGRPEAEVRTARCDGDACVVILRIDGACFVDTSTRAHDCALSDEQILEDEQTGASP